MRYSRYYIFLLSLVIIFGCIKPPEYSNIPEIAFVSLSKNTIKQDVIGTKDSILITLSFKDGDGDLGNANESKDANVFLYDSRDADTVFIPYKAPYIPMKGGVKSITGEITLKLNSICCYSDLGRPCEPNPNIPTNSTYFNIHIKDRAGNKSNIIQTPPITILCNE